MLPLVGRRLPIVADAYSDPEKGSGAVKITPGHDFNDFEVGRRHDLAMISILDAEGRLNDAVPEPYRGLDRFVARERVLADLEAPGLIEKIEPIRHAVPYSQRSETPVEPMLSDQWYADAKTLAAEAIRAVEDGRTRFVPGAVGHDLLRVDAQHPALVHLAPALVGPSDPGLVRARRDRLRRDGRGRGGGAGPRSTTAGRPR